jgi:hypothetical protein
MSRHMRMQQVSQPGHAVSAHLCALPPDPAHSVRSTLQMSPGAGRRGHPTKPEHLSRQPQCSFSILYSTVCLTMNEWMRRTGQTPLTRLYTHEIPRWRNLVWAHFLRFRCQQQMIRLVFRFDSRRYSFEYLWSYGRLVICVVVLRDEFLYLGR